MGAQAGRKVKGRGRMAVRAIAIAAAVGASGCALFGDYDFEGYRERPPEPTPPSGAPVLQGGFVGGAVQGTSNGVELRGRIVWHGSVKSTPNAQGIELVGWLR